METASKTVIRRINLLFVGIISLGLSISGLVYYYGDTIGEATQKLVQIDLTNFVQFQSLRYSLTNQERYLYEYYASFRQEHFVEGYNSAKHRTLEVNNELRGHFGNISPLTTIEENQHSIDKLAVSLYKNIERSQRQEGNTDWDLARSQLASISELKRQTIEVVEELALMTENEVNSSRELVSNSLLKVNGFVIIYSLITLLIAVVIARSLKAYLSSSAVSQRLSLFPKRTPNPIVSLDHNNQITYSNPATRRLLAQLGFSTNDAQALLSNELDEYQSRIKQEKQKFCSFEYQIKSTWLFCELHWLADQKQWDLHISDITEKRIAEEKLAFRAYHHPETCLANEYRFKEHLEQNSTQGNRFTVGLVEIRSFNQILSEYSLGQTQQLIKEIAAVLDLTCHKLLQDVQLFHIGDKNFALYLPTGSCYDALPGLVADIRSAISEQTFSSRHHVELDFGFACFPVHASKPDNLISNARMALNISASSSTHFQLFDQTLGEKLNRQRMLESSMRNAIKNEEFELHFQPQMSLHDSRMIGAEVLIRWPSDGQWISPGEFIPLAERSGVIVPLGNWILRKACIKAARLLTDKHCNILIAVNISPKQFSQADFVAEVKNALQESGLAPENLELEITEGVFFSNESSNLQSLHQLKKMGVRLAIDDFGTGYSSLSYLKQLPIDKLKIDQSFIKNLQASTEDQSIVRTIIDLGNNLELGLIAEGVEEAQQLDILKTMGCHEIQGYFYSKPLNESDFSDFLQNQQAQTSSA